MVKKEILKKDMGVSPDKADSWVLTFAQDVVPQNDPVLGTGSAKRYIANTEYDFGF